MLFTVSIQIMGAYVKFDAKTKSTMRFKILRFSTVRIDYERSDEGK